MNDGSRLQMKGDSTMDAINASLFLRRARTGHGMNRRGKLAEREGFEPSIRDKTYTPLAGERLQPLGHLSGIPANTCR